MYLRVHLVFSENCFKIEYIPPLKNAKAFEAKRQGV